MKQKFALLLSFLLITVFVFAQKKSTPKRYVGIHLNSIDVATPKAWKDNSGTKTLSGLKEQDLGFSLSFWQNVYSHVDASVKATMMFHNYSSIDRNTYTIKNNQVGIEIEPTANIFAFKPESKFNAFVTTGLGVGINSKKVGAYVPAGLGLSANFGNTTSILLQSQYRFTLASSVLNNNLFYSLGITQNFGK